MNWRTTLGSVCLALALTGSVSAQIIIDADRTITTADADDLLAGFTVNNGAVLTIAAGTTVEVSGPVLVQENARLEVAGTLAAPVRITFGGPVSLDYRPESATGIGMNFQHSIVKVAGATFASEHGANTGFQGGAFPAILFDSSVVEVASGFLSLRECNYRIESSLVYGNSRLLDLNSANGQFFDSVFIRRSRTVNLITAANAAISVGSTSGEILFENCRFSASSAIYSFNDSGFRFVNCDFSDTLQSLFNGFTFVSATFDNCVVSPVDNQNRSNQTYTFTNCFPDLPAEELVLNQVESTTVTITSPLAESPFRSGDVNGDGVVNSADVVALMDVVVGNTLVGDLPIPSRADADGNGTIDERDVAVLRAFVDGVIPQLPEVVAP